jgi:DNA polymerase III subunit delta'
MSDLNLLLLNKQSQKALESYLSKPSHALLICGQTGSGKSSAAKVVAASVLGLKSVRDLENYPYYTHLTKPEDKQDIPIELVRTALAGTRLKSVGNHGVFSRVIYIENAKTLSADAQNTLLKDLEDPTAGTAFILTATTPQDVLSTIASRCQLIKLGPVSLEAAAAHFSDKFSAEEIKSAWMLSSGGIGMMTELLVEGPEHTLKQAIEAVKEFLQGSTYQKMLSADALSQNKDKLADFITGLQKILSVLHRKAIEQGNTQSAASLLLKRKKLNRLKKQLAANANSRLIALSLALEI